MLEAERPWLNGPMKVDGVRAMIRNETLIAKAAGRSGLPAPVIRRALHGIHEELVSRDAAEPDWEGARSGWRGYAGRGSVRRYTMLYPAFRTMDGAVLYWRSGVWEEATSHVAETFAEGDD